MLSRDLHTEVYYPENVFKTYGTGVETPLKKRGEGGSVEESASSFIIQELGVGENDFAIRSSAITDTGGHVWVQQLVVSNPQCLEVAS